MERAARPPSRRRRATTPRSGSRLVAGGMSINTKAENLGAAQRGDEGPRRRRGRGARRSTRLRARVRRTSPTSRSKFGRPAYFSLQDAGRGRALRRGPRGAARLLAGTGRATWRRCRAWWTCARRWRPATPSCRWSSTASGWPRSASTWARCPRRCATACRAWCRRASRKRTARSTSACATAKATAAPLDDVRNLVLPGPDGAADAPARPWPTCSAERGPAEIHRLQQQRAAVISANLEGRGLGAAVADVRGAAARPRRRRAGITTEMGGQNARCGSASQPALRHDPGRLPGLPGDGGDLRVASCTRSSCCSRSRWRWSAWCCGLLLTGTDDHRHRADRRGDAGGHRGQQRHRADRLRQPAAPRGHGQARGRGAAPATSGCGRS